MSVPAKVKHEQLGRSLNSANFGCLRLVRCSFVSQALGQRKFCATEDRQHLLLGRVRAPSHVGKLVSSERPNGVLPRLVDGMTAVCHYGEGTTGIVSVNEHGPFSGFVPCQLKILTLRLEPISAHELPCPDRPSDALVLVARTSDCQNSHYCYQHKN